MPARRRSIAPQHRLLQPLGRRDDGTPISVQDRVVEALRLGASIRTAAARAGVSQAVLHAWLRSGNRLGAVLEAGGRVAADLSQSERAELAFALAVEAAIAQHELQLLAQLEQVSRGAEERVEVVQLDALGNEVARTTRRAVRAPDPATLRWRLERRHPEQWGARVEHDVSVHVDVASRAAELAQAIRAAELGKGGNGPPGG